MLNILKKHPVSNPAFYDAIIKKQKKCVRERPSNAEPWLELGRLYEDRIALTHHLGKSSFFVRYCHYILISLITLTIIVGAHTISNLNLSPLQSIGTIAAIMVALLWPILSILLSRYPPSGKKYFRRAISLDSQCGEAYLHLGLIALRRKKKQTACRLLERAVELNVGNKKIERKLKTLYEKEFVSFFNKKTDKETGYQEIIENQINEIKALRSKVSSLENLIGSINGKADQAKWKFGHKAKLMNKEMKHHISVIRKDYEDQIEAMKKEADEEAKEQAERHFVNLTTEIMESKANLEVKSLATASRSVEDIMGNRLYETLSEQTRSYLATAEHIYGVLTDQEEKPDYSLVGMELCKALETELNLRLVKPFTISLNGNKSEFLRLNKTGESKGRPSYFTYLAMVVDEANYPEVKSLTLGQYNFVLKLALEGDYALKEYGGFLDGICAASRTVIGKTFLKNMEIVTKKYRNAIAHQSPMNKKQYTHLRELIFTGEEALIKTCCEIVVDEHKMNQNSISKN